MNVPPIVPPPVTSGPQRPKTSNSTKIVTWTLVGTALFCGSCSALYSMTPEGRKSIAESNARDTELRLEREAKEAAKNKAKLAAEKAKREEAEDEQKRGGPPKTRLADWIEVLEPAIKHIRSTARDPDSVKVYDASGIVKYKEDGYLQKINFGARNGFGGMNRYTGIFVVRKGSLDLENTAIIENQ